jgi:peptidoglycan/LPS O-acetylase OafA/YrhL
MFQNLNTYFNKKEFDFHNNAFDFIRLILAISVVVFHSEEAGKFLGYGKLFYYPFKNLGHLLVDLW